MDSVTEQADMGIAFWVIMVIIVMLVYMQLFALYKYYLSTKECKQLNSFYSTMNSKISDCTGGDISQPLCNYNILTAYNCCSSGAYKNDYVNTCILADIIKQGARCLDFAIYSIDNNPVVASSTSTNYFIKETYNSIPFSDVMSTIKNNAFSSATAPNAGDPLFIHLRLYSTNKTMMNTISSIFSSINSPATPFLNSQYNYNYSGQTGNTGCVNGVGGGCVTNNLSNAILKNLMGNIIVIVNGQSSVYQDTDLYEWINIESGTAEMQLLRYTDLKNVPSIKETVDLNRTAMTMVLPNMTANPSNPNGLICRTMGCQFVAMRFQNADNSFDENISFFNNAGYAFVPKTDE